MKYWALVYRLVRCLTIAAVATILILVGAIQLQQWSFHHRAARLLRDIQSIQLRQTTFSEAQVLFSRWKDYGKFNGKCTENHCEFELSMETFLETREFNFIGRQWLHDGYARLGARPSQVFARIGVENGTVWDKSFDLHVGFPGGEMEDGIFWTNLMGNSGSVSRFASSRTDYTLHPEYLVGSPSGCEGCVELYSKFTPYADPRVVRRLMDINLSCLLPWSGCREGKDIMPGAWNQMNEDYAAHPGPWHESDCNEQTVQFLARDALSVGIFEVVTTRTEKRVDNGWDILFATVCLLTPLKRMTDWHVGDSHETRIVDQCVALTKTNRLSTVRPGKRFILLLTNGDLEEPCGAVPLTPHNLDLVSRGIALDYLAPYPELEIHNLVR